MKKLITLFAILLSISNINAQKWTYHLEDAKTIATKEDKKILLVFSGSDWCAPCIKLDRQVFQTKIFQNYANSHYTLLKADFPRRKKNQLSEAQKKHNAQLFETYNPQGYFPFVVVLNQKGETLGATSFFNDTPENYIKKLNTF